MTALRLVIFDVDGTLVDSQADIIASMHGAYASQGLEPPSDDAIRGIVGLSLPVALAQLAPEQPLAVQEALVAAYKTRYQALRLAHGAEGSPLFPGVRATLDRLTDDPFLQLGIATRKSRRGLEALIASHGLQGIFSTQQCADDHPSKPHPSMIEACLRETGVDKAQAVIVGDTEFDIEMGKAAGIQAIGVTWGYHPRARLARADALIDGFDQLERVLTRIWGQA